MTLRENFLNEEKTAADKQCQQTFGKAGRVNQTEQTKYQGPNKRTQ